MFNHQSRLPTSTTQHISSPTTHAVNYNQIFHHTATRSISKTTSSSHHKTSSRTTTPLYTAPQKHHTTSRFHDTHISKHNRIHKSPPRYGNIKATHGPVRRLVYTCRVRTSGIFIIKLVPSSLCPFFPPLISVVFLSTQPPADIFIKETRNNQ